MTYALGARHEDADDREDDESKELLDCHLLSAVHPVLRAQAVLPPDLVPLTVPGGAFQEENEEEEGETQTHVRQLAIPRTTAADLNDTVLKVRADT
eukprot:1682994-Rhodomonas_salina.2